VNDRPGRQHGRRTMDATDIEARLTTLRQEFEAGRAELHALEMRQTSVRETLLRIDGAVQVLEELLTTVNQSRSHDESVSSESQ
jgi:hypothetical protein